MQGYRELKVWQKAMDLVVESYNLSKIFPNEERFGLTSQLRRAAVSIPANIAEGKGRRHLKDYLNHLYIAQGSLLELETHIEIARRLGYLPIDRVENVATLMRETGKMLNALTASLRSKT